MPPLPHCYLNTAARGSALRRFAFLLHNYLNAPALLNKLFISNDFFGTTHQTTLVRHVPPYFNRWGVFHLKETWDMGNPNLITDMTRAELLSLPNVASVNFTVTFTVSTPNDPIAGGMFWGTLATLAAHGSDGRPVMVSVHGQLVPLYVEVCRGHLGASVFRNLFDWECAVEYLKRELWYRYCGRSADSPLGHLGIFCDGPDMFRSTRWMPR